jgi:hypothetical protein
MVILNGMKEEGKVKKRESDRENKKEKNGKSNHHNNIISTKEKRMR